VTGLRVFTTALASSKVGTYTITPSQATAANYSISFVDGKLSVTKAALTITAENKSKVYGAALPTLTATFSGLVNGDKSTVVTGLALGTTALTSSPVGSYKITPSKATAANYDIKFVDGSLTVTKAALTIRADDKSRLVGENNPTLTATFTGLVNGDSQAVVSGLALGTTATQSSKAGTYAITAKNASAANYTITLVDGLLSVNQAPAFTSANSARFTFGRTNSFQVTVSGFPTSTFQISQGALPAGVTLDQNSGKLASTATAARGTYKFTLSASNGIGSAATQAFTLTIG
jgi:hypothetical protein